MLTKLITNTTKETISLRDIEFIKKFLRYPINSFNKLLPFILIIAIILLLAFLSSFYFSNESYSNKNKIIRITPILFPFILMIVGFYKHLRSLFFEKIMNNNSEIDNITLLTNFFISHHFRYNVMSHNPEVCMMQSSLNWKNDEQEIVVFIAIENGILINSHISTSNILPKSNRTYKELKRLLEEYSVQNSTTTVVKRF